MSDFVPILCGFCHTLRHDGVDPLLRRQPRAETAAELAALLPAILDKAFKGELTYG